MYTNDSFTCGICATKFFCIEKYVCHMIFQEQCVMVLTTCNALHDLQLPRFKKKQSASAAETLEIPEWKMNAVQVNTGTDKLRWKCRLCNLTFSREKAFVNHYFLRHESEDAESKKKGASNLQDKCSTAPAPQEPKLEHFDINTPEINKKPMYPHITNENTLSSQDPSTKLLKFTNAGTRNLSKRNTKQSCAADGKNECSPNLPEFLKSQINKATKNSSSLTSPQGSPAADKVNSIKLQNKPTVTMILKESDEMPESDAWIIENEETIRTKMQRYDDISDNGQVIDLEPEVEDGISKDDDVISIYDIEGVSCRLCSQAFKTSRNLQQHMSVVHASSRAFMCGFSGCGQAFKTKGSLTRHHRRHTGERPYTCAVCGRSFRESGTLKRHLQARVSCALKTDAQLTRYRAALPLPPQDSKSSILKFMKKEEFMANEDSRGLVDAIDQSAAEPSRLMLKTNEPGELNAVADNLTDALNASENNAAVSPPSNAPNHLFADLPSASAQCGQKDNVAPQPSLSSAHDADYALRNISPCSRRLSDSSVSLPDDEMMGQKENHCDSNLCEETPSKCSKEDFRHCSDVTTECSSNIGFSKSRSAEKRMSFMEKLCHGSEEISPIRIVPSRLIKQEREALPVKCPMKNVHAMVEDIQEHRSSPEKQDECQAHSKKLPVANVCIKQETGLKLRCKRELQEKDHSDEEECPQSPSLPSLPPSSPSSVASFNPSLVEVPAWNPVDRFTDVPEGWDYGPHESPDFGMTRSQQFDFADIGDSEGGSSRVNAAGDYEEYAPEYTDECASLTVQNCFGRDENSSKLSGKPSTPQPRDVKPRLLLEADVKPRLATSTPDIKPRLLASSLGTSGPASNAPSPSHAFSSNVKSFISNSTAITTIKGVHVTGVSNSVVDSLSNSDVADTRRVPEVDPHGSEEHSDAVQSKKEELEAFTCVYKCMHCDKSFKSRSILMKHLYSHVDKLGPQCSECRRTFSERQGVVRHMAQHRSVRRFVCPHCAALFRHRSQLLQHCLAHSRARAVPCGLCGRTFKTVSARNLHARSHSGGRVSCAACGGTFATRGSLLRHSRSHSGLKPYVCRHCHAAFRDSGTLARHLRHKKPCCFKEKEPPGDNMDPPASSGVESSDTSLSAAKTLQPPHVVGFSSSVSNTSAEGTPSLQQTPSNLSSRDHVLKRSSIRETAEGTSLKQRSVPLLKIPSAFIAQKPGFPCSGDGAAVVRVEASVSASSTSNFMDISCSSEPNYVSDLQTLNVFPDNHQHVTYSIDETSDAVITLSEEEVVTHLNTRFDDGYSLVPVPSTSSQIDQRLTSELMEVNGSSVTTELNDVPPSTNFPMQSHFNQSVESGRLPTDFTGNTQVIVLTSASSAPLQCSSPGAM